LNGAGLIARDENLTLAFLTLAKKQPWVSEVLAISFSSPRYTGVDLS